MHETQINFIGGEKGGIGKSVVARLVAQYWIDRGKQWKGFDTDRSHGALLRYYADFSAALEISCMEDLDAIVETAVESEINILVDLAAQTEDQLHRWVEDSDVLATADEFDVPLRFWYVMDDGKDSINLLTRFLNHHGENAEYVIVLNHSRGEDFSAFWASDAARRVKAMSIPFIEIKALHRPTMHKIDQFDKSFWAALNNDTPSEGACLGLMERQRVKKWLKHAYSEFERIGL